jgi:hypothetical protein
LKRVNETQVEALEQSEIEEELRPQQRNANAQRPDEFHRPETVEVRRVHRLF